MKGLIRSVASFGYIGYLPVMPGTFGSLAGALIAWYGHEYSGWFLIAFSFIGFLVCRPSRSVFGSEDPKPFVLDEVCGMMLSVLWLPKQIFLYLAGFVLFRILDIAKPWPIRKIQADPHPSSIMWDDLAAGAAANIVLQLAVVAVSHLT